MRRRCLLLVLCAALAGCSRAPQPAAEAPRPAPTPTPAPTPADPRPVIAAFGDSLTAGHGLEPGLSYPDVLQKELDRRGKSYRVVNLGISGDTTSGGVARLNTVLDLKPAIVILELGANDGLRGLPLATTRANLTELVETIERAGARIVLAGMTLPTNYGPDYIQGFEVIFKDLARGHKLTLIPFLLEGVATDPTLMQRDALHPNAAGTRKVAAHVLRHLEPLL